MRIHYSKGQFSVKGESDKEVLIQLLRGGETA